MVERQVKKGRYRQAAKEKGREGVAAQRDLLLHPSVSGRHNGGRNGNK